MKTQNGFSLIELAIVLVIVTILIGGLAVPLSAQIEARRIAETRKTLEEAREAIFGYAMSHQAGGKPYLPCPAINDNGRESRLGTACTSDKGFFPWADLGTAAQDAWGNRLHYSLTISYGDSAGVSTSGFSNTSTGDKQVCTTNGCATVDVASNVPVVLVSYGSNGWGARTVNNTTLAAPTSADEFENTNADSNYVSRTPSKPGSAAGEFDDLVVWISQPLLISRVCPTAGGCP